MPLAITPTFSPWTHTSDDSYIYQLSLVLATATVSYTQAEGTNNPTGPAYIKNVYIVYEVPLRDVLRGVAQERIENVQHARLYHTRMMSYRDVVNVCVVVPVAACTYHTAAETPRPTDCRVRYQTQQLIGSYSNTARTNYRTRACDVASCCADGRQACIALYPVA